MQYGSWKESLSFDGQEFGADLIEDSYAERAGLRRIFAVHGLPERFTDSLVVASQVSDAPHTWRVRECASESEVTPEIVDLGRAALSRDRELLNAQVITYLGERESVELDFLAAGAIRDKLTRDYQNPLFPVVSRAIVAPRFRGKGIGSLIVEHRMRAAQRIYGVTPKAIHFGSESAKILSAVRKVEQADGVRFVYIGDEVYQATDGPHVVHDYLCFLPWYQDVLLANCELLVDASSKPELVESFRVGLKEFMQQGIEGILGAELERRFRAMLSTLPEATQRAAGVQESEPQAIAMLEEIFFVKQKIGATDPA